MGSAARDPDGARPDQVSVVVPVFGPAHLLVTCLAAISATTTTHELVLVDNATGHAFPDHAVAVRNPTNLGFARACNQGAHASSGTVLVFLNVDTEPQPGWLPPLVHALSMPGVGIAGSRLVYPDGRLQHAGVDVHRPGGRPVPANRQTEREAEDVEAVTAACMAVRRRAFDLAGGFDEGYWNGAEDVDLCLTVRSLGMRVRYEPASVVVHHESATGPERWAAVGANLDRLARRWGDEGQG